MPKLKDLSALGGIVPMIAANAGDDAGFALGMVPGLAYKDRERKKEASAGTGMKKGGSVKSASARADGCAQRGKTRGKMV